MLYLSGLNRQQLRWSNLFFGSLHLPIQILQGATEIVLLLVN
jgi:hypothetical protein